MKYSELSKEQQSALDKKYKRFQRKFVKDLKEIKGTDLEQCRKQFAEKHNIEL